MIAYKNDLTDIRPHQLGGFFEGWANPPSPETHLQLLRGSSHAVLALSEEGNVVGFVTAISDGVLTAYLPLLEVLPGYRRQGIGSELVASILTELDGLYSINLHCDPELHPFYESLGMRVLGGMAKRNYSAQSGRRVS